MKRARYCLNALFFFVDDFLRQLVREILQTRVLLVNRIVISVNKTLEFVTREDDVCISQLKYIIESNSGYMNFDSNLLLICTR